MPERIESDLLKDPTSVQCVFTGDSRKPLDTHQAFAPGTNFMATMKHSTNPANCSEVSDEQLQQVQNGQR
jgi:hypothetical protein